MYLLWDCSRCASSLLDQLIFIFIPFFFFFVVVGRLPVIARLFQDDFDNDVDALLEEGMPVPKKMRLAEDKYTADSDHQSDTEQGVQPMITKIKTVLKSESVALLCLGEENFTVQLINL